MKKVVISLLTVSLVVFALFLIKCKKDAVKTPDPQSGKDFYTGESSYSEVFKLIDETIKDTVNHLNKNYSKSDSGECYKTSVLPIGAYPKTMTLYYDSVNGCNINGTTKKGSIIAVISSPFYKTTGATIKVSFHNFYVNDNKVGGEILITNNGRNSDSKLVFQMDVTNGSITNKDGTSSMTSTKTLTWTGGESTPWPELSDDVYEVTANGSGTNINGNTFTFSTSTTLVLKKCDKKPELVSGILDVTPKDATAYKLDFGSGDCDKKATIKIDGLPDISIDLK